MRGMAAKWTTASIGWARALVRARRLDEADQVLGEAASVHPRDVAVRKARVLVALRRRDGVMAERVLDHARRSEPKTMKSS